jgi:hypothetical protein
VGSEQADAGAYRCATNALFACSSACRNAQIMDVIAVAALAAASCSGSAFEEAFEQTALRRCDAFGFDLSLHFGAHSVEDVLGGVEHSGG